jgi:CRISPR/Cas system-associated exonuclease Cas4 (RecB family)
MAIPVDQATEEAVFNEIGRICHYALEYDSEAAYPCNADWCRRCGYDSICSHT